MRRASTYWLLIPLLLLSAGTGSASAEVFDGQVVSTLEGQITVSLGGRLAAIEVYVDTVITLDGAPSTLDRLTPDHLAAVTARRAGNRWIALKIEARSQKSLAAAFPRFHR